MTRQTLAAPPSSPATPTAVALAEAVLTAAATEIEKLDQLLLRVRAAQKRYATFTQEQVDRIFFEAARAASAARIPLARAAVQETGMGVLEDKVIKNHYASEIIYNRYRDVQTCGVVEEDVPGGLRRIAEPVGILAGVIPTTNPTSTAIFKALLALKTRNAIVFSPHPRARGCTIQAARLVREAAERAGAPADLIAWIEHPTVELSRYLMSHPLVNLILATGGPGMVKAAYTSGTPALGVGSGNTPAVIDETADIELAVNSILLSKTFDNGMICASEQSVVVCRHVAQAVKAEFRKRGGYLLGPEQAEKVGAVLLENGHLNARIVGQSAETIARLAGIEVPPETKVLIGEVSAVGSQEPFSYEKLSPVLALYEVADFSEAVDRAADLVEFGGLGHTSVLYTAPGNQDRQQQFAARLKTGRVLINTPSSQGALGDLYNFRLDPSLTLGCGTWGGNSVSENVGVRHLLNLKTVAQRRENMLWMQVPPQIYFKYGCLPEALKDLGDRRRAFVVTDQQLYELGMTTRVTDALRPLGMQSEVFHDVLPDPTVATVRAGVAAMQAFKPDVVLALGGGSAIDAAKIMWLMYEHPELRFEDLALRFMDLRKRIVRFPSMQGRSRLVAIPTTSGTGSEVTPFAVITDEEAGVKYPVADYALTPSMAIVDPELVLSMPRGLCAASGIDAVTHAVEAFVASTATEFTDGLALEALRLLFAWLPTSYREGAEDPLAREKVHYAATLAGMAFANAFLGLCHSMAHKLGSAFHIPHGVANALLLPHVIRFNATDSPFRQATFSQYTHPQAIERYARLADHLSLGGQTPAEKVENLVAAFEALRAGLDLPATISEAGVAEADFLAGLDQLSELAFDDQCTGNNPRYPLISEIRELYLEAWRGRAHRSPGVGC